LSVSLSFVTNDDLVKELDDFTLFSKIYETLDIKLTVLSNKGKKNGLYFGNRDENLLFQIYIDLTSKERIYELESKYNLK
jgi:hypothetical protein